MDRKTRSSEKEEIKLHEKLIIIGVNGHGKVVADVAKSTGQYKEIEFLCNFEKKKECMGFPIIGKNADAMRFIGEADFIVAIGEGEKRKEIMEELSVLNATLATLIHPSAVIGSRVTIGEGTVVMAGTVIQAETNIGKGCIINTSSSVDHGCELGDYVHVAVGAHVCGQVKVGSHTWIGAGAIVKNGTIICEDCVIGLGAAVVKNIKERGTYIGVPARRVQDE